MKRLLSLFLSIALLIGLMPGMAFAADETSGTCGQIENINWVFDTETGTLTVSGTGGFPSYTSEKSVPWHHLRDSIQKVVIGDGITDIGPRTFYACKNLTDVTIPGSVTYIQSDAFYDCTSLTHITIPETVTTIGTGAFQQSGLTSVTIPASVRSIGEAAFSSIDGLTSAGPVGGDYDLQFAWTESIPANAFSGCDFESAVIPQSVTFIGNHAFDGCSNLTSVTIPDSVTTIGSHAFSVCNKLQDVYYNGTEADWNSIQIMYFNQALNEATIHYTSSCLHTRISAVTAKDPTCEAEGNSAYWYCPDCKTYFADAAATEETTLKSTVIPAKGHKYVNGQCIYCQKIDPGFIQGEITALIRMGGAYHIPGDAILFEAVAESKAAIASWEWDFGDGSTASGKTATHSYAEAGDYTVTLTVTDVNGTSVQTTAPVTVSDLSDGLTQVSFTVCDAVSLNPLAGAELIFDSDGYADTFRADENGQVRCILPNGAYTVSGKQSGYIVRTVSITAAGGADEYTLGLTTGSIMSGQLTSKEMTYEEIIDAGVNVGSADNQHFYEFKVTLTFTAGLKTYEIPVKWYTDEAGNRLSGPGDGYYHIDEESDGVTTGFGGLGGFNIGLFPISEHFVLVVYGESHWLKEMYNVELLVVNNSNTDILNDVEATLELPEGLSLADTYSRQSLTQQLGTVSEGGQTAANWYVRGDKAGEYNLTAHVSAEDGFGTPIDQTYTTSDTLKVYAGNALHMTITADDIATRGTDYTVKFRLENVSTKPIYNLTFGITGSEQYKVVGIGGAAGEWEIDDAGYGDAFTRTVDELAPGGYIEMTLTTTIWFNSALELVEFTKLGTFVDAAYYLTNVSVTALEGSTTTIPYSVVINRTDRENLIDKVIDDLVSGAYEEFMDKKLPGGSLGGTLIEVVGALGELDSWMVSGAKTVLKLQQGETDHKMYISIDDGLATEDSIYNDYVSITTGSDTQGVIDTLNGTKLTVSGGELSIQAKGPGSTNIKVGVENQYGELENEWTLAINIDDNQIKHTATLSPEGFEKTYQVNEDKWTETLKAQQENEMGVLDKNPFLWFDSALVWELDGSTEDSNYELTMSASSLDELLNETATTHMNVEGAAANLSFDRAALSAVAEELSSRGFTIAARRLSESEMQSMNSNAPTYQFEIRGDDDTTISDFHGGQVKVTVPYTLPNGADPNKVYVEHITDDTVEILEAEYDSAAGTVSFVTDGFSYFRIVADEEGTQGGSGSGGSSSGGSGSNSHSGSTTNTVVNDDGSRTTTVENAGTVTETTVYPNGDKTVVETKPDGTVTTTETDTLGNRTVTVAKPDGSATVTRTQADGVTVTLIRDANGVITGTVDVPSEGETQVLFPANFGSVPGTVRVQVTYPDESSEIVTGQYANGMVSILVSGSAEIQVLEGFMPTNTRFHDVPDSSWYADAVQYVYENGMMNGTSETMFSPDETTTRAMIVTILHRLENEPATSSSDFTDVAAGSYYADAVAWAAANGIVNGVNETSFAPDNPITREQLAAILYRYAQFKGYDVTADGSLDAYTDAAQISNYAAAAMKWANAEGLLTGVTATTLNPQGSATRAQVATILMRFAESIAA